LTFWIDAQPSPYLARWLTSEFGIEAKPVRELGLRDARDRDIFLAARDAGAVVMTKDRDFVLLQEQLSAPPQILWITLGNTSNAYLKNASSKTFPPAQELLLRGEPLVEISDG
jgi:predicted nuclease of predicted toxin-antitoxin system